MLDYDRGGDGGRTFAQRLCVYDKYWTANSTAPVFFYTGNESPVEEYVNNSGLMWGLAEKYNALVVFAEHRYFGESVPELNGLANCMSYLSSQEALADYVAIIGHLRRDAGAAASPVVAFGGSYGGMLSAWLRLLYPSAVDGAIAASAPVLAFPLDGTPLDSSAIAVTGAASEAGGAAAGCADNLKAAYVLLSDMGKTEAGRAWLSSELGLCSPLTSTADVVAMTAYLQTPLFDLAEGSYPFPSDYITFALTGTTDPLPPWPMRVMCDPLGADFGVRVSGDQAAVKFSVSAGDAVQIDVDWAETASNGYSLGDVEQKTNVAKLLNAVVQGIQIWYNVSSDLPECIQWNEAAPNARAPPASRFGGMRRAQGSSKDDMVSEKVKESLAKKKLFAVPVNENEESSNVCTFPTEEFDANYGWNALTCNEGMNLVNWWAQGVGSDLYWPPNQDKGYSLEALVPSSMVYCQFLEAIGLYGTPKKTDSWSIWEDNVYGGTHLKYATNIVFSNGNLDPWYPAGVGAETLAAAGTDASVIALLIDQGGHHVDLFAATEQDPASVTQARAVEEEHIRRWIGL
jgi:pimeloyl-ACP methyl ester carboxylesterase